MPDINDRYVSIHGIDVLIKGLTNVGGGFPQYMADVVERAMRIDVWNAWVQEISLTDHTLAELAALGHPYSTRYGPNSFVHPDFEVHEQSGDLKESSSIRTESTGDEFTAQLLVTSPHYKYLRYGTSIMRMRDPGGAALAKALPAIRERFRTEVKGAIIQFFTR